VSQKRKKKEKKRALGKHIARKKGQARTQRDSSGRTHLVVHRDVHGNTRGLTLSQPLFNDQWQNDVALASANTAHGIMGQHRTLEAAVELGKNAMAGTSKIADGALGLSQERSPACQSGCAHCCYQAVGVSAPEVLAIYQHLKSTRSGAELEKVAMRIRSADDRTRGMRASERLSPELPCPFLEHESCSIYEVRPLVCRGKNSLDADACEKSLKDPGARARFLEGEFAVPCFLEPIRAAHAVTAGLQLALHELHGLRVEPLELTAAMRVLLDDPAPVSTAWLAGGDPFAEAQGGDATDDPRIRELSGRRP
jgi:Fe-S-cluster containining protein